jgi:hypothetical protein
MGGWRCWGWVYKNQYHPKWKPNSLTLRLLYLLDNDETRVILTQPLNHRMPILRNVSRDLQARRTSCLDKLADLSAGWLAWKKTKTCKLCNESKTPHICGLQGYLEYEWRFPRVRSSSSKLISGHRKRPVTATCANSIDPKTKFITFVFAHLLERIKWLSAIWILKIKLFPIMCLYSCSYMFSCTDLVHVPTHYRLFTTHSWCDWNSKQQWDKK